MLDILIPVYNEGDSILELLDVLRKNVHVPHRILLCYDFEEDTTLLSLGKMSPPDSRVVKVKNRGRGAHGAVMTGFEESRSDAVLVFPADDFYNAGIIDRMYEEFEKGAAIVVASRFIPGGCMIGAPWLKDFLVRTSAWTLHHFARLPVHDATNGFRLFSKKVLDAIAIESTKGFAWSLELLVKSHRMGLKMAEVPAQWIERRQGASRFRLWSWLPEYIKWYLYAFGTTIFAKRPQEHKSTKTQEKKSQ